MRELRRRAIGAVVVMIAVVFARSSVTTAQEGPMPAKMGSAGNSGGSVGEMAEGTNPSEAPASEIPSESSPAGSAATTPASNGPSGSTPSPVTVITRVLPPGNVEIPPFHIAEVRVDGRVLDDRAEMTVTIDVEINRDDGWYDVPLRLGQAHLLSKKSSGAGKQSPADPALRDDGLHWLFQGAGTHRLEFELAVPVRTTPTGRHLQLSLPIMPALFEARVQLKFPQSGLVVRSFNRDATIRTRPGDGSQGTILEGSIPAARLELIWQERSQLPQPDWMAESTQTLERAGAFWRLTVMQSVRRTEAGRGEILMKPPEGFTIDEVRGPHLESVMVATDRPGFMRLSFGDDAPDRVEARWILKSPFQPAGGVLNLSGLEIDGVRVHSGRVRVLSVPGYQLTALPDSLQFLERVDDQAASAEDPAAVLVYAFSAPQWRMALNAKQIEPLFACLPRYEIDVSQGRAQLKALFRIQQNAGDVRELRVDVSGLEKQGWVMPPTMGTQISRAAGSPGVLVFPFSSEPGVEKSAEVRFERPVQEQSFEIPVSLPLVSATWLEPAEVIVRAADAIRLDVTSAKPSTAIAPFSTQRETGSRFVAALRLQRDDSSLTLKGSVESRQVIAQAVVAVNDVQPKQMTIEQTIRLQVDYGRLDAIRIQIPDEVPASPGTERYAFRIRVNGRDVENIEVAGRLLRVPFQMALIGPISVSLIYALPRKDSLASIPIVRTPDASYSEVVFESPPSFNVAIPSSDDRWQAVPTSPDRLRWVGRGDLSMANVVVAPSVDQSLQRVVIPSAYIETILTEQGVQRTTAQYRISAGADYVIFRLPEGARNPSILVDGKTSRRIQPVNGSEGNEWQLEVSRTGQDADTTLTIAYELTDVSKNTALSKVAVPLPEFISNVSIEQSIWNLRLPETRVVLASPVGMNRLFSWTRSGLFWLRQPTEQFRKLVASLGFETELNTTADPGTAQYPYGQLGTVDRVDFWTIDRSLVVLFGAGVTLVVGFLFWTFPRLRNAVTFLLLLFGICLAGVWVSEPMQVFLQPALVGVLMATAATVIDGRARRWRRPTGKMESSIRVLTRPPALPMAEVRSTLLRPAGSDHGISG